MFCQCKQKATVRCCNYQFCGPCFLKHFTTIANHMPQQLVTQLDPSDKYRLIEELNDKMSTLILLKSKVISEARELIKTIENLNNSVIQELNQQIKKYEQFLCKIDSVDLIEVENILTTEIRLKNLNFQSLVDEIKRVYPRDLISFDVDAEKLKSRKKKHFLREHNGEFNCLAISGDGQALLTGSSDATLRVWT